KYLFRGRSFPGAMVNGGLDGSWPDGIDPDLRRRELLGDAFHEHHDAALAGRIIGMPGQGIISWTLLMQMILPAARDLPWMIPCFKKIRIASRAQRNCPVRFTPRTKFHFSSVISWKGESRCRPALLTR